MLCNTEQEQLQFSRRKNTTSLLRNICKNSSNFPGRLFHIFTRTPTIFQEKISPRTAILNNHLSDAFEFFNLSWKTSKIVPIVPDRVMTAEKLDEMWTGTPV